MLEGHAQTPGVAGLPVVRAPWNSHGMHADAPLRPPVEEVVGQAAHSVLPGPSATLFTAHALQLVTELKPSASYTLSSVLKRPAAHDRHIFGERVTSQYAPFAQPATAEQTPGAGVGFGVGDTVGDAVGAGVGAGVGDAVGDGVGGGVG